MQVPLGIYTLFYFLFLVHALSTPPKKHLAGPPEEFASHRLPLTYGGGHLADSAYLEVHLKPDKTKNATLSAVVDLRVDSHTKFAFSFFSPLSEFLHLRLTNPRGERQHLHHHKHLSSVPIGSQHIPETSYVFNQPHVGIWKLHITTTELLYEQVLKLTSDKRPEVAIILWNESPLNRLNTYHLHEGKKVGVISHVTMSSNLHETKPPFALKKLITHAAVHVKLPNEEHLELPMYDDGIHHDESPDDGMHGGLLDVQKLGVHRMQAVIQGEINGVQFIRTTQHVVNIVPGGIHITGKARGEMEDWDTMNIEIEVSVANPNVTAQRLYRAYAEVYGTKNNGKETAVCWIGGMVDIQKSDSKYFFSLQLNMNWLALYQASAPLVLRNVYLVDSTGNVPVSEYDGEIEVPMGLIALEQISVVRALNIRSITPEMRQGKPPKGWVIPHERSKRKKYNPTGEDTGAVVMVHGYCSIENPWKTYTGWTDAEFFLQPYSNMGNEEFAHKIYTFAERLETFGIIAHSQGGMAAVHLMNYYFTGLDLAVGERVIQSVGTPYRGCTAAGSVANLGILFGIGCGPNWDLSTDGARVWLSGISSVTQKEVWYYTTTYSTGSVGDYCSLATNFILRWPNDGTAELDHTNMTYAHYLGNTEKWCHTSHMNYPPQYWDADRNKVMNEAAAR